MTPKSKQILKRISAALLAVISVFNILFITAAADDSTTTAGSEAKLNYYYNQLTTADARGIYSFLEKMLADGILQNGNHTVDLIENNVLENREYNQNALMADFISARDAFMLDNSDVFYVDFDKLTITHSQKSANNYVVTLGIGREDTYFADGFDKTNVKSAIADFNSKVDEIAALAGAEETAEAQIKKAYLEILNRASYALEADAKPENVLYVRNAYGALVRGETVCEGYARALKTVLDRLGVDNVLVQGTFADGSRLEPHMWNYVRMEDNRWYLLDATMEDGNASPDSAEFFLKHGRADVVKYYQPDGVISLSENSFEFIYPVLSAKAYEPLTSAFTAEKVDYYNKISYNGMGIKAAEAQGKYILTSANGNIWYYYENLAQINFMSINGVFEEFKDDTETYFIDSFCYPFFAVTDIPDPQELYGTDYTSYYTFTGDIDTIKEQSKVEEAMEYSKVAPVAVTHQPSNSRLEGGKTYDVMFEYSESLKLANNALPADIEMLDAIEGAAISEFKWDGDRTVTFKLKTVKNYNFVTGYYFKLINLVGVSSLREPNAAGLSFVNNPVFACPKVPGSASTVYANTPVLISESNLEENGWLDADNNPISGDLPNRLSLVASEIGDEKKAEMLGEIAKTDEVLAAQTFEISLGLCSNQIAYVTGKKIKVYVPFPAGYSADSNVSFKAFHFNAAGEAEEIECITTETGIIMLCNSFSPFAVIATANTESAKKAITVANGNGSFDTEFISLKSGETKTVNITADEGYIIDKLTLNGVEIEITDSKATAIELSYNGLAEDNSILEASFILEKIEVAPLTDGWSADGNSYFIGGSKLTGVNFIDGKLCVFDENGNYLANEIYTGLYNDGEKGWMYIKENEIMKADWVELEDGWHYFTETGYAANGFVTISGRDYLFEGEQGKSLGAWDFAGGEIRFYFGNDYCRGTWAEIDGSTFYFDDNGLYSTGKRALVRDGVLGAYEFDRFGQLTGSINGVFKDSATNDVFYAVDGEIQTALGLVMIDGDYYYITSTGHAIANRSWYVDTNSYGLAAGTYNFDENGKLQFLNGIVEENGVLRYYINGEPQRGLGLVKVGDAYYYVRSAGIVVANGTWYVGKENAYGFKADTYTFGADGKMVLKNGIIEENGTTYYYVDGVAQRGLGLVKVGGDYYYVRSAGVVVTGRDWYVDKGNAYGFKAGTYVFGADGKMVVA